MTFVEWLRVRNIARILAIVLGIFILITLVMRIAFNNDINLNNKYLKEFSSEPGTTVTDSVLPDGTKRKTIDNPSRHEHITIDDLGYGGYHVVITEPSNGSNEKFTAGSMHVVDSGDGKMRTSTIDTNGSTPFIFYMVIADLMAFVIATLLATPFAREADGHLEFALTRPVSRTTFALGVIGVDLAGIVICSFMTVGAVLVCQLMFEMPRLDFSGINGQAIVMGFVFPFAWYAMINAATASLSRGYGAIQGFAWPVAILVMVFGVIVPWGDSLVGHAVHDIFWTISRLDPLTYTDVSFIEDHATGQIVPRDAANFALRVSIELLLFAVYSVLAVLQWRRVEA